MLLGAFFRPVLGVSFCHPLVGRSALKRGEFHIQLSSLLARTLCVSLQPTKEWVLALLLLALLPLALPWRIGLLWRPRGDSFHLSVSCAGFHAWWLASGTSGSRTSRYGLLVYDQGASDSLPHPSPGREVEASVFGVAVRALLLVMSLPNCMDASPALGQGLSVSAFKGLQLCPYGFLVLKCRDLTFS